ncbi:hypothetical protein [Breoghania corrubedonensis]
MVGYNGTQLNSNATLAWQQDRGVGWHDIAPGKADAKPLHGELLCQAYMPVRSRSCIQMKLARYPQLSSRVGFAHAYRPLQDKELTFVLTRRWRQLGLNLDDADFTDTQAVATIVRITDGNFRLVHRLFVQIERILRINGLKTITDDVVEAARSVLVIGAT